MTPTLIRPLPYAAPPARSPGDERQRLRWFSRTAFAALAIALLAAYAWHLRHGGPPVAPTGTAAPDGSAQQARPAADELADAASVPPTPQARRASQAALAQTLEALDELLARDAEHWARSAIHASRAHIAAGERAYREQRYPAALAAYAAAREQLATVAARVPERVAALRDAGALALATGDSAAANSAFAAALELAPDDPDARHGLARAATLDRVRALIAQAAGEEARGARDAAVATYREVLALDAAAPGAAAALERIAAAGRAQRFTTAMSAGYAALEQGDYAAARRAFTQAGELDAVHADVADALRQVDNAATAAHLAQALAAARTAVSRERWSEALRQYDAALAIDADLADIDTARRTAQARVELDRRLEAHLADPGKLAETAARDTATRTLATARPLAPGAPRLAAQVQRLEAALAATARRPVRLRSDALTDVEVSGQPALGRFHTTELALPPGRYWAIGRRDGYREVRVEFAVEATTDPLTIEVSCQDPRPAGN